MANDNDDYNYAGIGDLWLVMILITMIMMVTTMMVTMMQILAVDDQDNDDDQWWFQWLISSMIVMIVNDLKKWLSKCLFSTNETKRFDKSQMMKLTAKKSVGFDCWINSFAKA